MLKKYVLNIKQKRSPKKKKKLQIVQLTQMLGAEALGGLALNFPWEQWLSIC